MDHWRHTCSQPLRLRPKLVSGVVFEIPASSLARSTMSAMRRAHSGIPIPQWLVPKPLVEPTDWPLSSQITSRECVAPLRNKRVFLYSFKDRKIE